MLVRVLQQLYPRSDPRAPGASRGRCSTCCGASGFERVGRDPVSGAGCQNGVERLKSTAVPEDVRVSDDLMAKALTGVARTLDANADILNRLLFSYMDYAVVGYRA